MCGIRHVQDSYQHSSRRFVEQSDSLVVRRPILNRSRGERVGLLLEVHRDGRLFHLILAEGLLRNPNSRSLCENQRRQDILSPHS